MQRASQLFLVATKNVLTEGKTFAGELAQGGRESRTDCGNSYFLPPPRVFLNNLIILISAPFRWLQLNKRKQGRERVVNPPYLNMMSSLGSSLPLPLKKVLILAAPWILTGCVLTRHLLRLLQLLITNAITSKVQKPTGGFHVCKQYWSA